MLALCDTNPIVSEDKQVIFGECQSVYFSFVTSDLFWEECVQVALVMSRVNKIAEERSDFKDFMVTFLGGIFHRATAQTRLNICLNLDILWVIIFF